MIQKKFKRFTKIQLVITFLFVLLLGIRSKKESQIRSREKLFKEYNKSHGKLMKIIDVERDENLRKQLESTIRCQDRDYESRILQDGPFWILKNYIRADHGLLNCYETVTYTTHCDYSYLGLLPTVVERWMAPISLAIFAPGNDFDATIESIQYVRNCLPNSHLIRQLVTFHIFFGDETIPKDIPEPERIISENYDCPLIAPYENFRVSETFRRKYRLLYPINVARNVARESALTHYVLACDIELLPSLGLVKKFLKMLVENKALVEATPPRIFPLLQFELDASIPAPNNKAQLRLLIENHSARVFHYKHCKECHAAQMVPWWINNTESDSKPIFSTMKRQGKYSHWEPVFIGTINDPYYDERLSREGLQDAMIHSYILCMFDYDLHVLNEAFLFHASETTPRRNLDSFYSSHDFVKYSIQPELWQIYGHHPMCLISN